jgi:DNA-binding transcriptional ArsR family regulator
VHIFTLLGEPVRLRIVELLAKRERYVFQLVDVVCPEFSISAQAVSHHLRVLRDEQFVEVRHDGRGRRYRLAWDAMHRVDSVVEGLFVIWEDRVGWPYDQFLPPPPARLHRAGRKGLRGRTRGQIEPRVDEEEWWFKD